MTAGRLKAQIVLCVIGIFDLPTFRELGPAVPVETEQRRTVVDCGFFTALSTQGQAPTAKMTKGENKYHAC